MRQARLAAPLLCCAIALSACAGLGSGTQATAPAPPVPASAPPEVDYLVARDLELAGRTEEALAAYQRALTKDPESAVLLRKVAELAARRNQLDVALENAERAHAADPDDERTRLFLATLYRFAKRPEQAAVLLTDEAGDPRGPEAAHLLYAVWMDEGAYERAAGVARWFIAEGDDVRGYLALAEALERGGKPAEADAALRDGLEVHEGDLALYSGLARLYRERGDRDGEIDVLRESLRENPGNQSTLMALSEALIEEDRTDEAIEVLLEVERDRPEDLRVALRIAYLYYEREDWLASEERFQRALEANPGQHEVRYYLGVVQRRRGAEDAALATFEAIPPDHERYPEARTQIAAIYEEQGNFAAAIAEVERARDQREARPLDLYVASLRSKAGDHSGALSFLEELLDQTPEDPELLYNIGVIHGEAQEPDQALVYMEQTLAQEPEHAGALNYIGYTWAEQGTNLEQAEEYITRALEARPDDGFITDSLGWVYYRRAEPLYESGAEEEGQAWLNRAQEQLERAAELTGGDPVISEHLGDVYLLRGNESEALRYYEEAERLGPRAAEQPELPKKLERLRREAAPR